LKCEELVKEGAKAAASPSDVVKQCDVTYAVLADPAAALEVGSLLKSYTRQFWGMESDAPRFQALPAHSDAFVP